MAPQSLDLPLKLELSKCEPTDPVVTELIGGLIKLRRLLQQRTQQVAQQQRAQQQAQQRAQQQAQALSLPT